MSIATWCSNQSILWRAVSSYHHRSLMGLQVIQAFLKTKQAAVKRGQLLFFCVAGYRKEPGDRERILNCRLPPKGPALSLVRGESKTYCRCKRISSGCDVLSFNTSHFLISQLAGQRGSEPGPCNINVVRSTLPWAPVWDLSN